MTLQSNMTEFILAGQNQKGNTFKPAYLRIFCEVAMDMSKGEFTCVFSRTEDIKITKDTRTNWLVIESIVVEHNLKECFNAMFKIAELKALKVHTEEQKKELEHLQSVTLSLKFKSIESEDLFKGKIPFDKFNTEFIKGIKYKILVHDIFPENLVAIGKLNGKSSLFYILKKLFEWLGLF